MEPKQYDILLRGGRKARGYTPPTAQVPSEPVAPAPVHPAARFTTTPPLPTAVPRGQFELPNMPGGPSSLAPIPYTQPAPSAPPLALEPKGLPPNNTIPYTPRQASNLSLAGDNIIDPPAPSRGARTPTYQAPGELPAAGTPPYAGNNAPPPIVDPAKYGRTPLTPQQVQDLQAGIQQQKAIANQAAMESNIARRFRTFNTGEGGQAPRITPITPQQVQDLQAGIQQQKAAASQAAGESNIARRFGTFNAGEASRVTQAATQGALRRAIPGIGLGAVVPALTTVAAQTAAEQNMHPGQSVGQSFAKVATNPQTAADMFRASGLTNSAEQLERGGSGSLMDRFQAASKDARNLIDNNLFNPIGHAVESAKSLFSGDPVPSTPLIPDAVTGANATAAPVAAAPVAAAPVAAAPVAAAPVAAAPVDPQAVFAQLQQERGFSPLGGKDPNARISPSIYSRTDPIGTAELERRQYATRGGSAEGVVPRGAGRGGFVGAATDAEAARNLQARAEQDAAASQMAAGFDRTTERLRDNRAEAMGISRAKLDASEGRVNPLTALFAPQGQQATSNPFSQPGDGFGDAELRRSTLERRMGDTRLPGAERRGAAEAYKGFLGPAHGDGPGGPANGHSPDLFNLMDKLQDNQRADQGLALNQQQLQETRRANQFNQDLRAQQERRASDKQYSDQGKAANEAILKDRTKYLQDNSDKKSGYAPQMDQIANFGVWLTQNSPSFQQSRPDFAKRILDGTLRYEDWGALDQMHKAFESSKPGMLNFWGSPASADDITQRYFDFNAPK